MEIFWGFGKHHVLLIKLTIRMPGIGYVEPYEVASILAVNKTYARNRLC